MKGKTRDLGLYLPALARPVVVHRPFAVGHINFVSARCYFINGAHLAKALGIYLPVVGRLPVVKAGNGVQDGLGHFGKQALLFFLFGMGDQVPLAFLVRMGFFFELPVDVLAR